MSYQDPYGNSCTRAALAAERKCRAGKEDAVYCGNGSDFLKGVEARDRLITCKKMGLTQHVKHCKRCDDFAKCRTLKEFLKERRR